MKAWLSRTQIRQRPMLAVYAGLLILIAVVIGAASLSSLTRRGRRIPGWRDCGRTICQLPGMDAYR